jgi:hypothetical protein
MSFHGSLRMEEEQMTRQYYAHSLEGKPPSEWQPLEEHLRKVAELAWSFAKSFGAGTEPPLPFAGEG